MLFDRLVELFKRLDSTAKRLEMTYFISEFLKEVSDSHLEVVVLLVQGRIFPRWNKQNLGVSSKLMIKAISSSTGFSEDEVIEKWKEMGDLGEVAEELCKKATQQTLFSKELTVNDVFKKVKKLSSVEGEGSVDRKIKIISSMLSSASPEGVHYIVRIVLEDLRLGVGEGTLRDSIAWAFLDTGHTYLADEKSIEVEDRDRYDSVVRKVQKGYDRTNDFAKVALAAKKGVSSLEELELTLGKPVRVMLAQKESDIEDAFERTGRPSAIEFKYDGFRMQIHKDGEDVNVFTRRLEDVTEQFPEVVDYVKEFLDAESAVLDAEAVGYDPDSGVYKPFQSVSQRIKRKYEIDRLAEELPVEINVFDIVFLDGEDMLEKPFGKRRDLLESVLSGEERKILCSKLLKTSSVDEAESFYKKSLDAGNEGLMFKNLEGVYKPGSRVGHMVKLKPVMDSLDLVIVGAEWGTGKRSGWLTSFTVACVDEKNSFLEVGKFGTGIKEKEEGKESEDAITFEEITEILEPLVLEEDGRQVRLKPEVVVEVKFEEIQKSPTYDSGYALRFPRFVRLRDDRASDEASSLRMVEKAYKNQSG